MAIGWLTLLGLCLSVSSNLAVEIPNNTCPYFSYRQLASGQWIGLIQAPEAGILEFNWFITFVIRGRNMVGQMVSQLEHYPSEEENLANIRNGGHARVFVNLQESMNTLPYLRYIRLNYSTLCVQHPYEPLEKLEHVRLQFTIAATVPDKPQLTTETSPILNEAQPRIQSDFEECGQEGFAATQHGGDLVTRGQFPWLAALYEGGSNVTYKCVASVLSKRTVITAAHCVHGKSASKLWVYLGRHDRNQNPEDGADLVGVSNVLTPPQYNGNPHPDSDVGLLVLKQPIWYTRYIQPLCLWSSGLAVPAREGDTGSVAGWGHDESGLKTRYPKVVSVRLVPRDQCLIKMKKAQDFITQRTVCAGNMQSHGPCFGDSGAALIVLRNNRWVIRGVVSISPIRGDNCDLSDYVIYCDVSTHLDWIQQNMVM